MKKEWNTVRPVVKYKDIINDKGKKDFKAIYLDDTPTDEIDRMNKMFNEWKTTKQIKYDKDGIKIK